MGYNICTEISHQTQEQKILPEMTCGQTDNKKNMATRVTT